MYRTKNGSLPGKVQEHFTMLNTKHVYMTRSTVKKNFYCQSVRTKLKSFCISVAGVKLWNNVDMNVKNSISFHIFKKKLKQLYIDSYMDVTNAIV